ncbi:glycosyltransferase family 2 protein [Candidatus Micrarchaeota archaeon]|nr:glycosyltransferase family 2 protein [Candidatus Micrarchaeota archaeon]
MEIRLLLAYGLSFLTLFATVFFILVYLENRERVRESPKPPKKLPSLTIIIPAYNEEDGLAQTIQSVLDVDYKKGVKNIIVVDDGSKDRTPMIARPFAEKHKNVTLIRQKNAGKARALNNALSKTKTELVATLDADSFIQKDALLHMVGYFSDPKVAAVTPLMKVYQPKTVLEKLQRVEYLLTVFSRKLQSFIHSVTVTPGPLSMFRRNVFDEVGGYDEGNILEDQEMAYRIQGHQYQIASSLDAVVYTRVPKTLNALVNQRVRWHRGGIRNIIKHWYLVSPKYGDFGLLVMPLAILSIFAVFIVFLLMLYAVFSGTVGELFAYGLENIYLGLTPLHVLGVLIFTATVAWAYLGIRQMQGERLSTPVLALYLLIYTPLITFFWLVTAFRELRREKLKW